jgi:hypothetical protein
MNKNEKIFVIFYYLYIAIYLPVFFYTIESMPNWIIPFHLIGVVLSIIFTIIIIKDILNRDFSEQNRKAVWIFFILFVWPTSVYYVFKHGFKERMKTNGAQ